MAKKPTANEIHARLKTLEDRANVAAYVVTDKDGKHIGSIRFHYPRDGAGRLTCSAADWSLPIPGDGHARDEWTRWQIGWDDGAGHDRRTAAMHNMTIGTVRIDSKGGKRWDAQLRDAGYNVIQAV